MLVVPLWTTQPWYTELLIDYPLVLPRYDNQLTLGSSDRKYLLINKSQLMACRLSGDHLKTQTFRSKQPIFCSRLGAKEHKKQYITYIKKWFTFCRENQIDSVQANICSILKYLKELFESGCGYSVINTARCVLSAIGIAKEGFAVGAHPLIVPFMKGVFLA